MWIIIHLVCFLGGYSQGGGLALHLAYEREQEVAGVFALSSFQSMNSSVYKVHSLLKIVCFLSMYFII